MCVDESSESRATLSWLCLISCSVSLLLVCVCFGFVSVLHFVSAAASARRWRRGRLEALDNVVRLQAGQYQVDEPQREEAHGGDQLVWHGPAQLTTNCFRTSHQQNEDRNCCLRAEYRH
jgi:hypothetical protein